MYTLNFIFLILFIRYTLGTGKNTLNEKKEIAKHSRKWSYGYIDYWIQKIAYYFCVFFAFPFVVINDIYHIINILIKM